MNQKGRSNFKPSSESPAALPHSLENWRAFNGETRPRFSQEFLLYSDSDFVGDERAFGPYLVTNLIAGDDTNPRRCRPVLCLRIHYAVSASRKAHHSNLAGMIQHEFAALASMLLGVRLKAGGSVRFFDRVNSTDETGTPRAENELDTPVLMPGARTAFVRNARREVDIGRDLDLDLLESYTSLSEAQAIALIRAARQYQEALWICEREPWLAWLLLVLAVEAASGVAMKDLKGDDVEILKEFGTDLFEALTASEATAKVIAAVAASQKSVFGPTKKFHAFLREYMPPAPTVRPSIGRVDWDLDSLTERLKEIYRRRSKFVHSGTAFPPEVLVPPHPTHGGDAEVPWMLSPKVQLDSERNPVLSASLLHLHVFEYIVRGAVVRWWRSMATNSPAPRNTSRSSQRRSLG